MIESMQLYLCNLSLRLKGSPNNQLFVPLIFCAMKSRSGQNTSTILEFTPEESCLQNARPVLSKVSSNNRANCKLGSSGPFQVIDSDFDIALAAPKEPPKRKYDCPNYECCLGLAAALNWDSFTCRGCNGEVNTALQWQAKAEQKRGKMLSAVND